MNQKRIFKILLGLLITTFIVTTITPLQAQSKLGLSDEEKEYLKDNPALTIAIDTSWIPYAFIDDEGVIQGIIPNLLQQITKETGLRIKMIKKDSYQAALLACQNNETNLVSGIAYDEAMKNKTNLNITDPYITINYSVVAKNEINDLYASGAKYQVAVCKGSYATMAMKKKMPSYHFVEYDSNNECMAAIESNETDIALIATHAAEYYASTRKFNNLNTLLINDFSWGLSFGVNKHTDSRLISILNKGIQALNQNDIDQASYTGLLNATTLKKSFVEWIYLNPLLSLGIGIVIIALTLIIVFLIIWQRHRFKELQANRLIQSEIDQKNKLLDSLPGGVGWFEISNNQIQEVYLNNSFYRNLVMDQRDKRDQWTNYNFINGVYQEDRLVITRLVERLCAGAKIATCNYRGIKGDGELVWIHLATLVNSVVSGRILVYCSFSNIDDIIAIQQSLQVNSTALQVAITSAQIKTWQYDLNDERITMTNGEDELVFEHGVDYLIAEKLIHPEYSQAFKALYQRLKETKVTMIDEFLVRENVALDYLWYKIILTPIYDETGCLIKAIGTAINIQEQKENEEKYTNQLNLMTCLEADNLIVKARYNLSLNKCVYQTNKNLAEDKSYDQILDNLIISIIDKQDEVATKLARKNLLNDFNQGELAASLEYKCINENDNISWHLIKYSLFKDPDSGDIIAFMYTYDVTKQAIEQEIIHKLGSDEYDILGLINVKTGRYKIETQLSMFAGDNRLVEGDYQAYLKEIIKYVKFDNNQVDPLNAFELTTVIKELEQDPIYYLTYFSNHRDEWRRKKSQFSYLDETRSVILYYRSDITNIYQKEQEHLKQIETSLENANKANSAKSDFLAAMSHDIRTPMNAIVAMTDLALENEANQQQVHETLTVIKQSAHSLLHLINDILDMSRIETGALRINNKVFSQKEVLKQIVASIKPLIDSKQQNLDFQINILHDSCIGDEEQLKRVLMNLLSNAMKFTGEGGHISFKIEELANKNNRIITYRYIVNDDGIGMDEDCKEHLFETFYRSFKPQVHNIEGTGLGLAIVKNIVDLVGGTIAVVSELNHGSTFTIDIPFQLTTSTNQQVPKQVINQKNYKYDLSKVKILLVEDHPVNQLVAKRILEKVGAVVDLANNGQVALAKLKEDDYDIILMDIQMPIMNGYECTRAIRNLKITTPIVAMTANAFSEDIHKCLECGMDGHVAKPINPSQLCAIICQFTQARSKQIKPKVLIVDDVEVNAVVVGMALALQYDYDIVSSGQSALDKLKEVHDYVAVVTDIQMPNMDGIALIKSIRANHDYDNIAVLANTQYGDMSQEEQLLSLGADDFIYKPTNASIVIKRLNNVLSRYQK